MNPELQKYVSEARQRGLSDEQIRVELLKAGWGEENFNQMLPSVEPFPIYTPNKTKLLFKILGILSVAFAVFHSVTILYSIGLSSFKSFIASYFTLTRIPLIVAFSLAGYGFFKLKRWILPTLYIFTIFSILKFVFLLITGVYAQQQLLLTALFVIYSLLLVSASLIVFKQRSYLTGNYFHLLFFTIIVCMISTVGLSIMAGTNVIGNYASKKVDDEKSCWDIVGITASNKKEFDPTSQRTFRDQQYGFEFQYPSTWSEIRRLPASPSDYLPTDRTFIAIYPTTNRQDFSARIDTYNVPVAEVLLNNPYIDRSIQAEGVNINDTIWGRKGERDYLLERGGRTFHVSGESRIVDRIICFFKVEQ
jgi:hypothetical protein